MRLTAVLLGALALAGCGQDDEPEVQRSVERLYAAATAQDGAAMCRALTPALRRRLDRPPGTCAADALRVVLGPGPPRNVRVSGVAVNGDAARARAQAVRGHGAAERSDRVRVRLERVGGRWLVAGTGP